MSFLSAEFLLFFCLFFSIYFFLNLKWKNYFLLGANLLFFCFWGLGSLASVVGLAVFIYLIGKSLPQSPSPKKSRILLGSAILVVIAMLVISQIYWHSAGIDLKNQTVAFPVGLSFYSLQLLGYLFEINRRQTAPAQRFSEFLLFSSFFPQALMGPIERHSHMQPQFSKDRTFDLNRFLDGLSLISLGIFKKMVIADRLAQTGREVWESSSHFDALDFILFLFFAFFTLYADFSGYVDMARGIAKILGFDLTENFNQPYFSKSIGDFLNRWNISFVRWVRDFVYWPLALRTKNLFLSTACVFVVFVFWHGLQKSMWAAGLYWIFLYTLYLMKRKFSLSLGTEWKDHFLIRSLLSLVIILSMSFTFVLILLQKPKDFLLLGENVFSGFHGAIFSSQSLLDLLIAALAIGLMVTIETIKPRTRFFAIGSMVLLFVLSIVFGISDSKYFLYMRY